MTLHYLPFFGSQVSALLQDLVRDGNLAQVMKIATAAQGDNFIFIQQKVTTEIAGIFRKAFAVAFGIRISALNAEAKRAQNAFGGFKLVSKFFQLDKRLDARK